MAETPSSSVVQLPSVTTSRTCGLVSSSAAAKAAASDARVSASRAVGEAHESPTRLQREGASHGDSSNSSSSLSPST